MALIISAIGFYRYIWFISVGYGFSIAGIGVTMLVAFGIWGGLDPLTIVMSALLVVYGLRLGTYLIVRESRSASYRDVGQAAIEHGRTVALPLKVLTWIACAALYACEASPVLFRLSNHAPVDAVGIVGAAIMGTGIILESVADFTKNRFKRHHPDRFCDVGVFRIVRCPNYLGEVLTWTGVFVSGVTVLRGFWQWAAAIIGYVCIVWIMFGGARRLELRQERNYGQDPAYRHYSTHTPILIPLIPLYSVKNAKWLVG
ncbi:DUF1295 domain-containing protein [Bifidobacterium gallicum]|uniref:DUF1295 domain-containing protein n=1 Tax=Bifidobacterium gallicum TaxID=78342 RepID=UPI001EE66ABB|nr:DUF1295 domain-containing protein [Bifidobacterium gallicum]